MATTFLDPGMEATQSDVFYSNISGDVQYDSSQARTGPGSIKCSSQGGTFAYAQKNSIVVDSGTRISVGVRLSALPSTTTTIIRLIGGGNGLFVYLRTDGILEFTDQVGTKVGSTALGLNAWIRISMCYVLTSTANYTIKIFLDGALELTITQADFTLAAVSQTGIRLGWVTDTAGASKTIWLDDIYIDNSSSLADPGNIRVTAKLPASNNVNQFTTAIGANPANRWTNVNERPLSETNGWLDAVNSDRENYGIEGLSAGDVDLTGKTLVARMAWIWAKGAVGGLGSPKITNNGVDTAIVLTAAGKLFTNIVDSASYPSAADTIGMVSAGVADATSLYECGMLIAYIQAASVNPGGAFSHVIHTSRMRQW